MSTLAAVGMLILPGVAAAQPLVTLDRLGEWTLDRLGYADGRVSVLV